VWRYVAVATDLVSAADRRALRMVTGQVLLGRIVQRLCRVQFRRVPILADHYIRPPFMHHFRHHPGSFLQCQDVETQKQINVAPTVYMDTAKELQDLEITALKSFMRVTSLTRRRRNYRRYVVTPFEATTRSAKVHGGFVFRFKGRDAAPRVYHTCSAPRSRQYQSSSKCQVTAFIFFVVVPLIPRLFSQITNDLSDTCLPYFCDTEAYRGVESRPSHDFIAHHRIVGRRWSSRSVPTSLGIGTLPNGPSRLWISAKIGWYESAGHGRRKGGGTFCL